MKQYTSLSVFMVTTLLTISTVLNANTVLKPVYFDTPHANAQRLVEETPEVRSFLAQYEYAMQQVNLGEDMSAYFVLEAAENPADSVSHLLGNIKYDQGTPYNNLCPMINGRRAVTGCVATAMAQIMRYYSYPNVGVGRVTYTGSNGAETIDLSNYPFHWNLILDDYSGQYTSAQGEAVATLMLACGAALNMNYSADGSGSYLDKAMVAFKNNFSYSKKIGHFDSNNVPNPEELILYDWAPEIREQHKKGYPVMYAGNPAVGTAGHAFVIDGYKVIDGVYYYHVNWGWSGAFNGYYLLMNLAPDGENYAGYGCDVVINIYPEGWTDVEDVVTPNVGNGKIYNLLGVEVDENYKGVVIKNGKKYIQ